METKRPVGRPPQEPTFRLTVRIPLSVYEAFKQRSERLGFANAIDPIRRWIKHQADAPPR